MRTVAGNVAGVVNRGGADSSIAQHPRNARLNNYRSAFTLVELLVVIGIIALLIGVLLPALNKARQQANLITCQTHLRQIGQAIFIYTDEDKGVLPPGYWNFNTTGPYDGTKVGDWSTALSNEFNTSLGNSYGQ